MIGSLGGTIFNISLLPLQTERTIMHFLNKIGAPLPTDYDGYDQAMGYLIRPLNIH